MSKFLKNLFSHVINQITCYDGVIADPVEKIKIEIQAKNLFGTFFATVIGVTVLHLVFPMNIHTNILLAMVQIYSGVGLIFLYHRRPQHLGTGFSILTMIVDFSGMYTDERMMLCGLAFSIVVPGFMAFLTQSNRMVFVGMVYSIIVNLIIAPHFYEMVLREYGNQHLANLLDSVRATFNVFTFYDFAFTSLADSRFKKILNTLAVSLKAEEEMKKEREILTAKNLFFSCFSHEMRNPLNGILGSMDYAIKYASDDVIRDVLGTGKSCASMLLNLINNILDMGKLDSNNMALNEETKDSKIFITNIWRVTQEMFKKKKQQCEIFVDRDFPASITIDDSRLSQVIVNLISNACKFTDEGKSIRIIFSFDRSNLLTFKSVQTSVSAALKFVPLTFQEINNSLCEKQKISQTMPNQLAGYHRGYDPLDSLGEEQLSSGRREMLTSVPKTKFLNHVQTNSHAVATKYVLLYSTYRLSNHRVDWNPQYDLDHCDQMGTIKVEVIDTGCGMTQDEVSKVFKPFVQTKKTFQDIYHGTGLGLYITKSLVDLMKGRIIVESQPGIGSTFSVAIPNNPLPRNIGSDLNINPINKQSQFSRFKIVVISGSQPTEVSGMLNEALDRGLFSEYTLERTNTFKLPETESKSNSYVAVYNIYDVATLCPKEIDILKSFSPQKPQEFILFYDSGSDTKSLSYLNTVSSDLNFFCNFESLAIVIQSQTKDLLHSIKSKSTLLIVDDDPFNLKILKLFLTKDGYKVYTAENGKEGFEVYCSHPDEINMVITDYDMPICDGPAGAEMIVKFMSQNRIEPIPIYALTANVSAESKMRMDIAGIQKAWSKPGKMEEILSEIFHLMSRKVK